MAAGIPALTGLRFVAAGTVFAAHALPKIVPLPQNQVGVRPLHACGVAFGPGNDAFFVLSGFVIHYNYAEQIQSQGARGRFNFFVARVARLYPLYLFCLKFRAIVEILVFTSPCFVRGSAPLLSDSDL